MNLHDILVSISVVDIIGLTGAALIIFGFFRITLGMWTSRSLWYEIDNLAGATLLGIHELLIGAYIPMVLSLMWAIVAIKGLTSFQQRSDEQKLKKALKDRKG
ncbi:MAG: hypothetical protein U5L95_02890 [Candidatus Saccharibacteria bacterium]|nr:hypothetical protein [Candidatus Saccharibacteria bacterium]